MNQAQCCVLGMHNKQEQGVVSCPKGFPSPVGTTDNTQEVPNKHESNARMVHIRTNYHNAPRCVLFQGYIAGTGTLRRGD